jgi:hypothetical protein
LTGGKPKKVPAGEVATVEAQSELP